MTQNLVALESLLTSHRIKSNRSKISSRFRCDGQTINTEHKVEKLLPFIDLINRNKAPKEKTAKISPLLHTNLYTKKKLITQKESLPIKRYTSSGETRLLK